MRVALKNLVLMLTVLIAASMFTQEHTLVASSDANPRKIDLFTQKVPLNGKGLNQSSDAFQPQELVVLFANVTYNECPECNKLVAFQVNNPANEFWNITIVGVNSTGSNGIAQFSFRIPWPSENPKKIIFGEWFAVATVEIAGEVMMDALTFQVGWIIEIFNIETLNKNLQLQKEYFLGDVIVFNLTVKNIALTTKLCAIMIDVWDENKNPIIHLGMNNVAFQPGANKLLITSQIPTTSAVGEATVSGTAHTAPPETGGTPYCPAVFSTFRILSPSVKRYYLTVKTDPPNVTSIVGEEWYDESISVNLTAPKEIYVDMGVRYLFRYWDIDCVPQGIDVNTINVVMNANHTATAHYILQFYLTVKTEPIGIAPILGEGWYNESTYITLNAPTIYEYAFQYWSVDGIPKGEINTITIHMNAPHTAIAHYIKITTYTLIIMVTEGGTTNPPPGNYTYTANTIVQVIAIPYTSYIFDHWELDNIDVGTTNPNLLLMDKNHVLKAVFSPTPTAGWFVPDWFWWLLLLLIILLLLIWLYLRRRRRKKSEEAFHSGWTAWYYCYDLRKIRKV